MFIERVEVEGGFLDGLNLELSPAFNVIIGPRGTGKTSIVELLRFALGVPRMVPSASDQFRQARAVLGTGRVTVTVRRGDEKLRFVRSAADPDPIEPLIEVAPLILVQNEIEDVGQDPYGRLNLIDGFRQHGDVSRRHESAARERVSALTEAIATAVAEVAAYSDELGQAPEISGQLSVAEEERARFSSVLAAHASEQEELLLVDTAVTNARLRVGSLERAVAALRTWYGQLDRSAIHIPELEPPATSTEDVLQELRGLVEEASAQVQAALSTVSRAMATGEVRLAETREVEGELESRARELRKQLEAVQEGAGSAARRVAELRSRLAALDSVRTLVDQKRQQVAALHAQREDALSELEGVRQMRFDERARSISGLNNLLAPQIEITLTQFGLHDAYIRTLINSLRGSNMKYNAIAPQIAAAVPPAELVRLAETGDADGLAAILGYERERAARIVGYLSDHGLSEILGVGIEDLVEFALLDGTEYKTTSSMSTGQRCTVVLPILLGYAGRPVVVDQPEDHLDNNFVVDTLIRMIRVRKQDTQLLISSHNANIPVLGEADRIFSLASNGVRGYVRDSGELDDLQIVSAITSVMEGGREAFRRRAEFYEDHLDAP